MTAPIDNRHSRPRGVGLAYRYVIHDAVMHFRDCFDLLEISTADYIERERLLRGDPGKRLLREVLGEVPCVAHGLSLSIGSVREPDRTYLDATRAFLDDHGLAVFSDHLAFHAIDGTDLSVFLSMPFEEISIEWLERAYYRARRALGRPFALENVTYYFPVPGGSLSEADFLRRLTEETDCTLLLDATNVFNNAHNHGYDAGEFLDRLPLNRVSQVHLAGGHLTRDGKWEDSHSSPVMEPVWPLFEEIVRRSAADFVILERDSNFEDFEGVVEDVLHAREIFERHRPSAAPAGSPPGEPPAARIPDPDPSAPQFAQLRGFQRALMARLTDADFRARFDRDPAAACEGVLGFVPQRDWLERLTGCDPRSVRRVVDMWESTRADDARLREDSQDDEWAAWAAQLEMGAGAS